MRVGQGVTTAVRAFACLLLAAGVGAQGAEREKEYLLEAIEHGCGIGLAPGVDLGLLLEVEASATDGEVSESDISLATLEAAVDAALMPGLTAQTIFLYEEGENDEHVIVDVATVTLGAELFGLDVPLYLKAGKDYAPFGVFNTVLISDPLTLELAETQETLVELGWAGESGSAAVGVFNGDVDESGRNDRARDGYAAVSYSPNARVQGGVYLISDLSEGGLEDAVNGLADAGGVYGDSVPGAGCWLRCCPLKPVTIDLEYVTALRHFDGERLGLLSDMQPEAWSAETAWAVNDSWTVAARVEGAEDVFDDSGEEGLPRLRCGAGATCALTRCTVLSFEYLHSKHRAAENDNTVTAQIAVSF